MSKDEKHVIGIDAGTESCRVCLFDLNGSLVSSSSMEYPSFYPKPGWAEQDAETIWNSVCLATREVIKKAKVSPKDIAGVGADGTTSTVVAVDERGRPLRRAILWTDVRAAIQAEKATKTRHEVLKYCGGAVSAEGMTAKALWIKESEPELWRKARYIIEVTDWLMHEMTGRWTASLCNTSVRWNYVTELGGWPRDFFEQMGLEDVFEKWPKDVLPMGEYIGTLTEEAAEQLGLVPGIPVAQGGTDAVCGMVGVGAAKPGRLALVLGSSTVLLINSEKPVFVPGVFVTVPDAVVEGLWLHVSGEVSTGSVIKWFKDQFGAVEAEEARKMNKRVYEVLDEEAAKMTVGSEGVIVLEHWQGSRIRADPLSRGIIWGLSLATTRAHIFRAILEACAYSTNLSIERFRAGGMKIDSMWACGGGSKSKLLLQIHADVCGLPIYLTQVSEAVSLGSAMSAAVSAGCYKDFFEATDNMIHVREKVEPNPQNHEEYKFYYQMYKEAYPKMQDLTHRVTTHIQTGAK